MLYIYNTHNKVCPKELHFEIKNGKVLSYTSIGGCCGNSRGIEALIKNKKLVDIIKLLKGIKCNTKPTSCPDQIAIALEKYIKENGTK